MQIASIARVKTIQIRNVPEATHAELRIRAAGAGMSLSDYVLAELDRVASKPPIGEVLRRAQARSGGASHEAVLEAVRHGRDRD